jgi:hypothetical protein
MTQPTEQLVAYPIGFMQAIANYLAERPFKEVAGFIEGIQKNGTPVSTTPPVPPNAEGPAP